MKRKLFVAALEALLFFLIATGLFFCFIIVWIATQLQFCAAVGFALMTISAALSALLIGAKKKYADRNGDEK